jgi:general secretion pathway protein A
MYLHFYGLNEKPFGTTPDPKFLYLTPAHREALAQLIYGVQENKGFIVLSGEVGTGKTTLLHTLLRKLDRDAAVAFLSNSTLPFDDLVAYMLEDFGIAQTGSTRVERLVALNRFLIERCRAGRTTVLILDEAQNLTPDTLEQVRLLSNFETPTHKLLQILLVGQPELRAKLQLPELRQLKQRIGLRCAIRPLTLEETYDYIRSRLRVAGAPEVGLFTDGAVRRIAEYAGGIPRLINTVCDHCLLIGYVEQKRKIDGAIVEQAVDYLEEGRRPTQARRFHWQPGFTRLPWAWGGLGAVVLGGLGALALGPGTVESALSLVLDHLLNLARDARDLVIR